MTVIAKIKLTGTAVLDKRREFYEENRLIKWFIYILSFGSSFLGFFLQREIGLILGIFISIITWLLTPYAIIKVREITRFKK